MGLTRIRAQQISDIDYKQAVRVITTTNITLLGGAPSLVDGISLLTGDRVLVNGQTSGSENGIYIVQILGTGGNGTWVRSTDANVTGEIQAGMIIMVTEGSTYADTQWKLITNDPITVGTTVLVFEQNSAFAFGNIYANGTAVLADIVGDRVTFTPANNVIITANAASDTIVFEVSQSPVFTGNVTGGNLITAGELNTNDVAITGNITGDLLPGANVTYDLGSSSQRWRDIWLSNSTIHLGEAQISANATSLIFSNPLGAETVFTGVSSDIEVNTVTATGNISGSYILGNGSQLTGLPESYSNANVAAYLPTYTGNISAGNISVLGNVTGVYILGNGSQLSGMPEPYSNANVSAYLPVYSGNINSSGLTTGNISGGNISVLGNVTASYFIGNGSQLSGMYGNVNVAAYLPTYTGVLTAASVTASGNITGAFVLGNGSQLTGMYGNAAVSSYLPTYTGNIGAGNITATGNITAAYFSGNGSELTGMYGNSEVAAYLPTYTGNISAGNITATGTVRAAVIDSVNADLAERYLTDQNYEPGTVVVFGGDAEVTQSQRYADTRVAGVISTAPAYSMNSASQGQPVALQGRVPCRVQGTVRRGDLVTTSNTAGVATRLRPQDWVPGAVIGKALQDYNSDDVGVIEVVVGRL